MNLLILNTSRKWAGTETHSITLALGLIRRGHNVLLGCDPSGFIQEEAQRRNIRTFPLKIRNTAERAFAYLPILKAARKIKAEIVIANCGSEIMSTALVAWILSIRSVFVVHSVGKISQLKRFLLTSFIDKAVGVSGAVCRYLRENRIPEGRIFLIHNGIDAERFQPADGRDVRTEFGISPEDTVIGTAARLCRAKGVFDLVKAFSIVSEGRKNLRLLIVGDGSEKDALVGFAETLGISERIIFTGLRKDMERLYNIMDIFVLASRFEDPFPLAVLEAMASAKPVIATKVGGIPEMIKSGENGILIEPASPEEVASAIKRLLESPEFANRISAEGRVRVVNDFTTDIMAQRFEELGRRLICKN